MIISYKQGRNGKYTGVQWVQTDKNGKELPSAKDLRDWMHGMKSSTNIWKIYRACSIRRGECDTPPTKFDAYAYTRSGAEKKALDTAAAAESRRKRTYKGSE